jgi:pyruvate ferredoxin oxidoreductase gamma subunit
MIEVRFHGRGGQGAVVASELLAQALYLDGKYPQSFPFFGVERRGAPVTAYTRVDDRPIPLRTSVTTPDVVVVLEAGLLLRVPVTDGLRSGGVLLVNSPRPPEALGELGPFHVAAVDATRIALDRGLGTPTLPIVNTAVLGAFARATGVVSLEAVREAIDAFVPSRQPENCAAAADGFRTVRLRPMGPVPASGPVPVARASIPPPTDPVATVPSGTIHTADWRTLTPQIDLAKCTRCNFCWKFCPDDAIGFDANGFPVLRSEYCKGCGICAEECPPHAIAMRAEA